MNNTEFLAFLFVGFLSAIVFGIFTGIAIADRRKQRYYLKADNGRLEQVRDRAFARLDGRRPKDILDAEVID